MTSRFSSSELSPERMDDAGARHHHIVRAELAQARRAFHHVRHALAEGTFGAAEGDQRADLLDRGDGRLTRAADESREEVRHPKQRLERDGERRNGVRDGRR